MGPVDMAFFYIRSEDDWGRLESLLGEAVLGLDIETHGKNALVPQQSEIRLIQLASATDCFVIDMDRSVPLTLLRELLGSKKRLIVLHHAKFDVKHLFHHHGFEIRNLFCTMLASQLLAMGKRRMRHSLAEVALRYLGVRLDKQYQHSDWSGPLSEAQIQYAAQDAEILIKLHSVLERELTNHKLHKVSRLEFRTVLPVAAMEVKGIHVDQARLAEVQQEILRRSEAIEEELLGILESGDALPGMNTLNLNAPEQVRQALQRRGIEVEDTADWRLRPLVREHPFIGRILEYRHLGKILSSTLKPFAEAILPETGRIHSNYHQIASASGRFACSDPNIQQVPREKNVRACFRPQHGCLYVLADYSQVEMRVAAGFARDPVMLKAYRGGQDLHRLTAAITLGKPVEEVSSRERQAAKAINFGLIYAMGPRGLRQSAHNSYGVDMTLEHATLFRKRYFEHYRGIQKWQRELERLARKRGYVRTAAGRIRSYENEEMRLAELLNTPVQGTAAEGLKSALCIFWDKVKEAGIDAAVVAIIHDEIIVEVNAEQAERAKSLLREAMVKGIEWLVPGVVFQAEAQIADSWAEK